MDIESIEKIVVVGGGTMGQGIAQNFAEAGLLVRVVDMDSEILDHCLDEVHANLRLFQEMGLLKDSVSSIESRIQPLLTENLAKAVQDCDFIVEAVPEDLEFKKQLFAQLDSCPAHVILSSNTSSFTISTIAERCSTGYRIIGLHYFNPAHIMPLVEIHYSRETSQEVIATTKALMIKVGKMPIIVKKEIPGFIVNRIQTAVLREILYMVAESVASPEDIDMATKACVGFRWACIGPIEALDMVGLDVVLAASTQILNSLNNSVEPSPALVEKVKRGELGVKSGRGWFNYTDEAPSGILAEHYRRLLRQLALFKSLV